MTAFAAQKIHEAEAHIAAIDRELLELDAALSYTDGSLHRQVRNASLLLIQDRARMLVSLASSMPCEFRQLERRPRN